jgi:SprT protein
MQQEFHLAPAEAFASAEAYVRHIAAACFQRAAHHFQHPLQLPPIRFDLRGACAGQAVFRTEGRKEQCHLRFNAVLLHQNPEEFFSQVVAHEAAHVIARRIFGKRIKPHGQEWQRVMRDVLGVEPRVRHQMDVRRSVKREHAYLCGCETYRHQLSSIRHNRIQRQQQVYLCRKCRQPLRLEFTPQPTP